MAFSNEAEEAKKKVRADTGALRPLLPDLGYESESRPAPPTRPGVRPPAKPRQTVLRRFSTAKDYGWIHPTCVQDTDCFF